MVIAGAEGLNWGRSPVLDIERREFITLLGGAAIKGSLPHREAEDILSVFLVVLALTSARHQLGSVLIKPFS